MKKQRSDGLSIRLQQRVAQVPGEIVVRADVEDLGDYRRVSRAILTLIQRGFLIRIAYGIYAKARYSAILKKPVIKGGFKEAAFEALNRCGVLWEIGEAEKKYNLGLTTQVPVRSIVKLKSRFRRTISFEGLELKYE